MTKQSGGELFMFECESVVRHYLSAIRSRNWPIIEGLADVKIQFSLDGGDVMDEGRFSWVRAHQEKYLGFDEVDCQLTHFCDLAKCSDIFSLKCCYSLALLSHRHDVTARWFEENEMTLRFRASGHAPRFLYASNQCIRADGDPYAFIGASVTAASIMGY